MTQENLKFFKIRGKIELTKRKSDLLDIFYIVQWNNHSGPVTIQKLESLSNYVKEIAVFESKSTFNHFLDRKSDNIESNEISNDQVEFLLNAFSQYKNHQTNVGEKDLSLEEVTSTINGSKSDNKKSSHISVGSTSSEDSDNDVESHSSSKDLSTHDDVSDMMEYMSMDDNKISGSEGNKNNDGDGKEVDDEEDLEDLPTLMDTQNVFDDNFDNEPYYKPPGDEGSKENGFVDGGTSLKKTDDDYQLFTDSEDTVPSVRDFTERYPKSPESWSTDFTPVDVPTSKDDYKSWTEKWINMIKEDMKKCRGEANWKNLEIISEIDIKSKHYFICYDKKTYLLSIVEDDKVPESERYKIDDLKKVSEYEEKEEDEEEKEDEEEEEEEEKEEDDDDDMY